MKKQRNYDKRVKNTRIHLDDYLVLKRISQVAGVSMADVLHRLIEHEAQLPLPELRVTGVPAIRVTCLPKIAVKPVAVMATNGSNVAAFRIQPRGARYD